VAPWALERPGPIADGTGIMTLAPRNRSLGTPFAEPWRVTAVRTVSLAVAIGAGIGLYQRQLVAGLLGTVVALWFTLGGHFLELLFRNQIGHHSGSRPMRSVTRLGYWFVGGSVLYAGALATRALLVGRAAHPWPWWVAGVGFVGVELVIHRLLRLRGQPSFYDGLG
jgi:hypothetical protein